MNIALDPHRPYVGSSAFTHKAGLHTSALARQPDAYEHTPPAGVGNFTRMVVSEQAGRAAVRPSAPRNSGSKSTTTSVQADSGQSQGTRTRGLPIRGGRRLLRAAGARELWAGNRASSRSNRFEPSSSDAPTDRSSPRPPSRSQVGDTEDRDDRRGKWPGQRAGCRPCGWH